MTMTRAWTRAARLGAVTVVAVAAVGGATAAALGVGGSNTGRQKPGPPHVTTATITRKTLIDLSTVDGKLGYGAATPVTSRATGTVTWLPTVGTVVSRGESVLRADDKPIVLLYGTLPMYRQLTTGVKGDDVKQFKQNLKALGYSGITTDAEFTAATTATVKRWQKALKRDETGTVEATDVIYAAGPLRIATQGVRVGAVATGDVLTATTTTRVVAVDVPTTDQRMAQLHNAVTVILPDGKQVKGEVSSVGSTGNPGVPVGATAGGTTGGTTGDGGTSGASRGDTGGDGQAGGSGTSIPAMVSIADQGALGTVETAAVRVRYVAATHADVLVVPVQALLALAEGGFGLEIREGATRRVVAVRVGLFAGGLVEVTGDGIAEGTTVGVAE
jgi:Putative peptidoglycan binding domain